MLDTFSDLHKAFLRGIKKENTGTVTPTFFMSLWNEWAQPQWIADCVSMKEGIEVTEKKINDLQPLRKHYTILSSGTNLFYLPDGIIQGTNNITNVFEVAPKHMRTLNVAFKLDYDNCLNQECNLTGVSDWIDAKIMRSDRKTYSKKSAFRKPSDHNLYYDKIDYRIRVINSLQNYSPAVEMNIEYLMFPNEINSDPLLPTSILPDYAKQEIVQRCVKLYLEEVKDPRLVSFIQAAQQQPITNL